MRWYRLRWLAVALWVVLLALALPRALQVTHDLTASGADDPRSAAAWADGQLGRLPQAGGSAAPLSTLVQGLTAGRVAALWAEVASASGAPRPAARLVALPGHPTDVMLDVLPGPSAEAAATAVQERLARLPGVGLEDVNLGSAGSAVLNSALSTLKVSGYVAVPIVAVLLLLVFDSTVAAALPLVVALVGVVVALAAVDLLEPYMQLSVYLTNIVSFLALGVGVDYSLFLSARFRAALRRELEGSPAAPGPAAPQRAAPLHGRAVVAAVTEAMRTAGRSVFFSALAVAASMLALLVPRTPYWNGLAVGGCVAVLSVLAATLTLLPALLAILGTQSERGRLPRPAALGRFWPRAAAAVTSRPVAVLAVGCALLAVPALSAPGIVVRTPGDVANMLAPNDVQRLAVEQQQRDYGAGSIAPLAVALLSATPFTDPATWTEVATLTRRLQALPGVAAVESPTLGGVPPSGLAAAFSAPGGPPAALASAVAAPNLIALSVTSLAGPDTAATAALLARMQRAVGTLPPGWRGGVGGATAELAAFNALVARTLPAILGVVAAVALVVLFAASGSLWVALFAVAFDALVALGTAGLLVFLVQHGRLGFQPMPLDASSTPIIFVVLFGLSMDYEVILIHRIREHAAAGAPGPAAGCRALAETGGMITGAGLLMVVVFGSLILSPLQLMRTLALGLGAAILLDTWIVRTCLVPTSVALMGEAAWWPWGLAWARRRSAPHPGAGGGSSSILPQLPQEG